MQPNIESLRKAYKLLVEAEQEWLNAWGPSRPPSLSIVLTQIGNSVTTAKQLFKPLTEE